MGLRAVRLEEADARVVDGRQIFQHHGIRRAEAQPIAEQHDVVRRQVFRRILHAEHVGMAVERFRHSICDRFRVARDGRIDDDPFFHEDSSL